MKIKHFIRLQWLSMIRSASFATKLVMKILMGFGFLYFAVIFVVMGAVAYVGLDKSERFEPLETVSRFMIYYLILDLIIRYMMQKLPVLNIKPFLYQPVKKDKIVHFAMGETAASFFNWGHAFLLIPFTVTALINGENLWGMLGWHFAITALIFCNNYINILLNNKNVVFYIVVSVVAFLGLCQYYDWWDFTLYTGPVFHAFYKSPYLVILPFLLLGALYFGAFKSYRSLMYLDGGLAAKSVDAKTEEMGWLDRFGHLGTFLKNDIRLIKRNKRSKTAVIMSGFFLLYGLLFFTGAIEAYENPMWKIFAGIFVSGGFLFTFGQFVPSWDSSYYPLMMSQNITYKDYLDSKWYLVIIATSISMLLALPYLYFGWEAYAAVFVGGIFNIGVNAYLVLWGGAYIKTPIDLTTNKKAFGDSQAFNVKTLLLTLPKILLPMLVYAAGHYTVGPWLGYVLVGLLGLAGFAFKGMVFRMIERIYKREKYATLLAYKQK
ncbi:DUF5687 family protein [Sediminicola luteus]|uniref:Uncharacterized protein n=1 Tax=Sediminicola luteus TaxID=319238 RepID=A0A2A4GFH1_9FLAO|nr:DUF5687 family protein [Sediminicola luteus]PCE66492.1 hypothetical protein B7P33_04130 [Sediminicola luteus]